MSTHDTLAPPPSNGHSVDAKSFRVVYTRVSKLLEPLSTADRRRLLTALNALLGDP